MPVMVNWVPKNTNPKLGVNLSRHGYNSNQTIQYPFINIVKSGKPAQPDTQNRHWPFAGQREPYGEEADQQGATWIQRNIIKGGGVMSGTAGYAWDNKVEMPGLSGLYYLFWDGSATDFEVRGNFAAGTVDPWGGNIDLANGSGTFTYHPIDYADNDDLFIRWKTIDSSAGTPVNNIQIVHADNLARHQAGQIFQPSFVSGLSAFDTLRFMDWAKTNWCTRGDGSARLTLSSAALYGRDFFQDFAVIDQTDALSGVPIYSSTATWINLDGEQFPGVPLDIMIELCNVTEKDMWYCIPCWSATDEFMTSAVTRIRDNLNPDLRLYLEYNNENWNNIGDAQNGVNLGRWGRRTYGFSANPAIYNGEEISNADGSAPAFAHGIKTRNMIDIARTIFSGVSTGDKYDRDRLVGVYGAQWAAGGQFTTRRGLNLVSFSSADFPDQTFDAPSAVTDAIAIAPYWGNTFGLQAYNDITQGTQMFASSIGELSAAAVTEILSEASSYMVGNKQLADDIGARLIAYEGGQHYVAADSGWNVSGVYGNNDASSIAAALLDCQELFFSANHDASIQQVYKVAFDTWDASGGGDLHAAFTYIYSPNTGENFGIQDYQGQAPTLKYQILEDWSTSSGLFASSGGGGGGGNGGGGFSAVSAPLIHRLGLPQSITPARAEAFGNFSSGFYTYTNFDNATSSVSAVTLQSGEKYFLYGVHISNFNATTPFRVRIEHTDGTSAGTIKLVVAGARNGPVFLKFENPVEFKFENGGFVRLVAESIDTTGATQAGNVLNLIGVVV